MAKAKPIDNPEYTALLGSIAKKRFVSAKQLRLSFKKKSDWTTKENFSMKLQNLKVLGFVKNTRSWEQSSSTSKYALSCEGLLRYIRQKILTPGAELSKLQKRLKGKIKRISIESDENFYKNKYLQKILAVYLAYFFRRKVSPGISIRELLENFVRGVGLYVMQRAYDLAAGTYIKNPEAIQPKGEDVLVCELFEFNCYNYILSESTNHYSDFGMKAASYFF